MDSITIAWWKQPSVAIFVDYGQLPAKAGEAAGRAAAETVGLRYETVRADCSALGSGDLAGRPAESMAPVPEWWPFRNQLILTIAGADDLHLNETELTIGALRRDGVHADGRPEFIDMLSALMQLQEEIGRASSGGRGSQSA